jgi:hypothetical protein
MDQTCRMNYCITCTEDAAGNAAGNAVFFGSFETVLKPRSSSCRVAGQVEFGGLLAQRTSGGGTTRSPGSAGSARQDKARQLKRIERVERIDGRAQDLIR